MGVPESLVLGLLVGIFIGAIARLMMEAMKPGSPGEHA
jgi:uncharacterized membrane-anchored protein YhcB (DUF1043 family)